MAGELASRQGDKSDDYGSNWEKLTEDRKDGATSWDDLKNVALKTSEKAAKVADPALKKDLAQAKNAKELAKMATYNATVEKYGRVPTLKEIVNDAQESEKPVGEMSDESVILEYLGAIDMLSDGLKKNDGSSRDFRIDMFANGPLDELKSSFGPEIVGDAGINPYIEKSYELGLANKVIGNMAKVQQSKEYLERKSNERSALGMQTKDLERRLNGMGFFDRIFSPDRASLKELEKKDGALAQELEFTDRVLNADKSSLYSALEEAYGEEDSDDDRDVFKSELFRRFTEGKRGKAVARAVELYNQLGKGRNGWSREWHRKF